MVKTNEIKRSYYLNLFSGNAQIETNINDQSLNSSFFNNGTINITNNGSGYTEAPIVKIPELNYYDTNGILNNLATISCALTATPINVNNYTIINGGSNYANNDVITFSATGQTTAPDIKAIVSNGLITNYTSLVGGTLYVNAPTITATGGGTNFSAVSSLTPTTVSATFTITSGGSGYNTGDILNFDNTDTGGSGVSATVICNGSGTITGINLISAGSGYTKKAPLIRSLTSIRGPGGTGFNITCSLVGTSVASITILNSGTGYTTTPTLVFTTVGATGSGASASPITTNGVITGLTFTTTGSFTQKPTVSSIGSTGSGANIIFNLIPTTIASATITNFINVKAGTYFAGPPPNMTVQFTSANGLGFGATGTVNVRITRNKIFKWNIRDLQLGRSADIALVQLAHTNAANNTGYAIRCLETFADGFDSYNHTSAIVYLGMGLNAPSIPTYHKLISQNLNTITLLCTENLTSSSAIYEGINSNITFSAIFEVIDYIDEMNSF